MYFNPAQLRQLRPSPECAPPPPTPCIDTYNQDRPSVNLLSVLTSEAHIVKLMTFPLPMDGPEQLEAVHQHMLETTGANIEQVQLPNLRRDVQITPDFIHYDYSTDEVVLTDTGVAALALGH